jgi:hypothetical protein
MLQRRASDGIGTLCRTFVVIFSIGGDVCIGRVHGDDAGYIG